MIFVLPIRHRCDMERWPSLQVDPCIIGNGRSRRHDKLAVIVEHGIFVDGAIVFNRQIVAEGEFDPVKLLHSCPGVGKYGPPACSKTEIPANDLEPTGERSNICQNQMSGLRMAYFPRPHRDKIPAKRYIARVQVS